MNWSGLPEIFCDRGPGHRASTGLVTRLRVARHIQEVGRAVGMSPLPDLVAEVLLRLPTGSCMFAPTVEQVVRPIFSSRLSPIYPRICPFAAVDSSPSRHCSRAHLHPLPKTAR